MNVLSIIRLSSITSNKYLWIHLFLIPLLNLCCLQVLMAQTFRFLQINGGYTITQNEGQAVSLNVEVMLAMAPDTITNYKIRLASFQGSVTKDVDFVITSQEIPVAAGQTTATGFLNFDLIDDNVEDGPDTLIVTINSEFDEDGAGNNQFTIIINEPAPELPPVVSFPEPNSAEVDEGNTITINLEIRSASTKTKVIRLRRDPQFPIENTIFGVELPDISHANGSDIDLDETPNITITETNDKQFIITVPPNEEAITVPLNVTAILDDKINENPETVLFEILEPEGDKTYRRANPEIIDPQQRPRFILKINNTLPPIAESEIYLIAGKIFVGKDQDKDFNTNSKTFFIDPENQDSVTILALPPERNSYHFFSNPRNTTDTLSLSDGIATQENSVKILPKDGDRVYVEVAAKQGQTSPKFLQSNYIIFSTQVFENLESAYCIDDNEVTLRINPEFKNRFNKNSTLLLKHTGGIIRITANPVDPDMPEITFTFNPSLLELGPVTLTPENVRTETPSQSTIIGEQRRAVITNLDADMNPFMYCERGGSVDFEGKIFDQADVEIVDENGIFRLLNTDNDVVTDKNGTTLEGINDLSLSTINPGTYTLEYFYDANGCETTDRRTIIISSIPKPIGDGFTTSSVCVGDSITFSPAVSNVDTTNWEWTWNFGDGSDTIQNREPTHRYDVPLTYNIQLTIVTDSNCVLVLPPSPLSINALPEPNFTFSNFCREDSVIFVDKSQNTNNLKEWEWDFDGDNNIDLRYNTYRDTVLFKYPQAGEYRASLTVTSSVDCKQTVTKVVRVYPSFTPSINKPYEEKFNNSKGNWIAGGINSSWIHGNSNGNTRQPTDSSAWFQDRVLADTTSTLLPLPQAYNNNEQSFVESICFNLDDLLFPMMSLRYRVDTDAGADGAAILYTTENQEGGEWKLLGNIEEGDNWYNDENILGQPGDTVNLSRLGWSGQSGEWRTARFSLDAVQNALKGSSNRLVRFRVVFGSNGDNPSDSLNGFAFDDVTINERRRLIIVEHFTNAGIGSLKTNDIDFTRVIENNSTAIDIRYHTSFPVDNGIITNQENKADISSRTFYYGVPSLPFSQIDGIISESPTNFQEGWGQRELNIRSLADPPLILQVSLPNKNIANNLSIKADVSRSKTLNPITEPMLLQICLIEKLVNGDYPNVLRKFIPNTSGVRRFTWDDLSGADSTLSLEINWPTFLNLEEDKFVVVAFVQGETSREIYQAAIDTLRYKVEAKNGNRVKSEIFLDELSREDVVLHPNPAQEQVSLLLDKTLKQNAPWVIYDTYGKVYTKGIIPIGASSLSISIKDFPAGVYLLNLGKVNKKIIIMP